MIVEEQQEYRLLAHQFNVLCEINREINSCLEVRPLLDSIAENTARLLDADAVSVMMYDERMENFKTIAGWKSWSSEEPAVVFSVDEGIVGKVASTRRSVLVKDATEEPDFKPHLGHAQPPIKSLMCVPLIVRTENKEKLLGVINTSRRFFSDKPTRKSFTEKDIQLFENFSEQVTAAIERSRVFEEIRQRTLQLQIVNDLAKILSSSLMGPETFAAALRSLVTKMDFTFGQLVVMKGGTVALNFATENNQGRIPAPVKQFLSKGRFSAKKSLVAKTSKIRQGYQLECGPLHRGVLYLESPDPFFLKGAENRRVLETIRDQMSISLENFFLFQEVNQSKQKLENLNNMKNELISIVSHDFRNPLTVIHAYSELLLIRPDLDKDTRKDYLNSIFAQIGHLRRLADGALKITQIESGEMNYCFEKIEFSRLSETFAVRQLSQHRMNLQHSDDLPAIWVDFDKLLEILDNLVSNAIKYAPDGGEICIKAQVKDQFLEIQVKDKGIGIAPDQQKKLFQKYYRVHDEKTKHIRGTGLGLYICRKMVEDMGGKIGIRSRPGQGSTFFFTVPLYREELHVSQES